MLYVLLHCIYLFVTLYIPLCHSQLAASRQLTLKIQQNQSERDITQQKHKNVSIEIEKLRNPSGGRILQEGLPKHGKWHICCQIRSTRWEVVLQIVCCCVGSSPSLQHNARLQPEASLESPCCPLELVPLSWVDQGSSCILVCCCFHYLQYSSNISVTFHITCASHPLYFVAVLTTMLEGKSVLLFPCDRWREWLAYGHLVHFVIDARLELGPF